MPHRPRLQPQPDVLTDPAFLDEMDVTLKADFATKAEGRKSNTRGSDHEGRTPGESGRDRHVTSKKDSIRKAVTDIDAAPIETSRNPSSMLGGKFTPAPRR